MNWLDIMYPPEQIFGVVTTFADLNVSFTMRFVLLTKIISRREISAAEAEKSVKNQKQ